MSGFVKLHETILDSSVWAEPHATRIVWITMLAMADGDGIVQASTSGVARRAVVSREECEAALATLLSPDPDSRDGTTGERLEKVPGGWLILNHAQYRERRTQAQLETASRVRQHRKRRALHVTGSNKVTARNGLSPSEAEAEAEKILTSNVVTRSAAPAREPEPRGPLADQRQRSGNGKPERIGNLLPPDDEPTPTWKALVRGYQRRYEAACGAPWMSLDANRREIDLVSEWLLVAGRDVEAWLDLWFANPWAKQRRWPWKHAAKDPARFDAPRPTPAADRQRLLDDLDECRSKLRYDYGNEAVAGPLRARMGQLKAQLAEIGEAE